MHKYILMLIIGLLTLSYHANAESERLEVYKSDGVERYNISRGFDYLEDLNLSGFLVEKKPDSILLSVGKNTFNANSYRLAKKLAESWRYFKKNKVSISTNLDDKETVKELNRIFNNVKYLHEDNDIMKISFYY